MAENISDDSMTFSRQVALAASCARLQRNTIGGCETCSRDILATIPLIEISEGDIDRERSQRVLYRTMLLILVPLAEFLR